MFVRSNAGIHNESIAALIFSRKLVRFLCDLIGTTRSPIQVDKHGLKLLYQLVVAVGADAAACVSELGGLRAAGRSMARWRPPVAPPEAGEHEHGATSSGPTSPHADPSNAIHRIHALHAGPKVPDVASSRGQAALIDVESTQAAAEAVLLATVELSPRDGGERARAFERACAVLGGVLRMRGNVGAWISAAGAIGRLLDLARGSSN